MRYKSYVLLYNSFRKSKEEGVQFMKVLKANDVRALDQKAIQQGISSKTLMANAAFALRKYVLEMAKIKGNRIGIVCGPGNNGGDGFCLAWLLRDTNVVVTLIVACRKEQMSEDEAYYASLCEEEGIVCYAKADGLLKQMDIIVDCLFGTGLCRALTGEYLTLVEQINESGAYVIACDIPSGLSADEGMILGGCVKADMTITFVAGKLGLWMGEGMRYAGRIEIEDIQIPKKLLAGKQGMTIVDEQLFYERLPKRSSDSHKGSYGKALLIGGSFGMSGALILAGKAALRCGLGTCTLMAEEASLPILATALPEAMVRTLPTTLDAKAFDALLHEYDCIAIGNGLGRSEAMKRIVAQVWNSDLPCVFDGDALYLLGQLPELAQRNAKTVLTPHPKEVSYLLGTGIQELIKHPLETLYRLEKAFLDTTIVMKNTRTLISDGLARYINVIGNDGLATGGSGDVLCGMILGFMAQQALSIDAAICGVYLHAACADACLSSMSTYSILPSDVIQNVPSVLRSIITKFE